MSSGPQHGKDSNPVLTPPGGAAPQVTQGAGSYLWLWISLAAILLLGLSAILVLPRLIQPAQAPGVAVEPVVPSGTQARDAANQAMQSYLQIRAQLELHNASRWGEPEWSESEQVAGRGARMLAQREFGMAAGHYENALQMVQRLESERGRRFSDALKSARQALEQNLLETAVQQFELALAIQPDNEEARVGLARSRTRAAVLQHMAAGEGAEVAGDLRAAQTAYQQALELDAEYAPTNAALNRVSEELAALAFQDAMTSTLSALDKGQLGAAGKSLARASTLRPADPAVLDAQQRLAQARHRSRLGNLRRQAEKLARAEDWQAALDVYKKALAFDSAAGFARSGLEHAEKRLQLNGQFDHYLNSPERLYAAQPLSNAEALLSAARGVPADEPRLAHKIATLQRLVTDASTPVTVRVQSDGQTSISIYHVGQLGVFTTRELELLPGNYTVVGKRRGYRDVRRQLSVVPGRQRISLTIQCEEVI